MTNLLALVIGLSLLSPAARAQSPGHTATLSALHLLECERRLSELGYWVGEVDGEMDESTLAAVKAFRRLNGYKNPGQPNAADLRALVKAKPLTAGAGGGEHFVIDLTWQVIFFVNASGRASLILPVSTGSGETFTEGGWTRRARTPKGRFTVYRKAYGWREGPLGRMYYPNFIVGGVAVHGSAYVADYPRTHGCIAVPMFAAEKLSELMPVGTVVVVRD